MASTPLYKKLKQNGTTIYAFPGVKEDISASYQNSSYKMYFSKFALVNFPKQNLTLGTASNPIVMDFNNAFHKSANYTSTTNFNDSIVESLRNYVANHEVVMRESKLSNNKYYYDTNSLATPSEKIFFKWAKKLNLIDFEPAIPNDEYFSNLDEFKRNSISDVTYLPEYLWKEREVRPYDVVTFKETSISGFGNKLEIEIVGRTNIRVGDKVKLHSVSNSTVYNIPGLIGSNTSMGVNLDVLFVSNSSNGQVIVVDVNTTISQEQENDAQIELIYHKFIQYIGEVNGVSNVQDANRSYTDVYIHIPDHTGSTPDILFRTKFDENYKPNLTFPILPRQYQPEIMGAELFSSPIVNNPINYPGSYFAQFDTPDFTYETSSGDTLRRSGAYYGVIGDINNITIDTRHMDGISLDFNTNHYVKMNVYNRVLTTFEQFNSLEINNEPPLDFEYNAVLWYYTVEREEGGRIESYTNLYGISFLDNPDSNQIQSETGLRFPTYKKLVSNGNQDGTSYAHSLQLNFNISDDNPQLSYNPESINSLFSMNLFNKAMSELSSTNDSFRKLIPAVSDLSEQVVNLKQMIYTQTDLDTINAQIKNLDKLLRLYSTMQIQDSSSIAVTINPGSPNTMTLNNIEPSYSSILNIKTTDLYTQTGVVPYSILVPNNKNFMINIINNDNIQLAMPNNDRLSVILDKDLMYKQSVDIIISGSDISTENKKLDILVDTTISSGVNSIKTEAILIGDIDLPIFYNSITSNQNSAYYWDKFNFDIDMNSTISYISGDLLEIPLDNNQYIIDNSIKTGDVVTLNNMFLGTSSIFDFSGQYKIDSVVPGSPNIRLDVSNNPDFMAYFSSYTLPVNIHDNTSSMLSNLPYLDINKGIKVRITRIDPSDLNVNDKYKVEVYKL